MVWKGITMKMSAEKKGGPRTIADITVEAPCRLASARGIRVGSAKDGSIVAFIPDPAEKAITTSAAEGVAADSKGVIYGAEVGPKDLKKYVKK